MSEVTSRRRPQFKIPSCAHLLAGLFLGSLLLYAAATTIDFEGFPDSTLITTQYSGVTFSNAVILTSGVSLNEFEFPPHSGSNVISDNGGPISIQFSTPVTAVSGYFTYTQSLTMQAFDSGNNLVASAVSKFSSNEAISGVPGSSPNELIQVTFATGISSVVITGNPSGGSFVLDDVTYTPIVILSVPPTITKAFQPAAIVPGGTTTLQFQIANPNTSGLSGVAVTDNLPGGLQIANPNNLSSNCNGSTNAAPGAGVVTLTGGTIAASKSCAISVNIQAPKEGTYNNVTGPVASTEGGVGKTASASLVVAAPPLLTKAFSALAIPQGAAAALTLTLTNPNQTTPLTGVSFTDPLPTGLIISTPSGLTNSCGGTVTANPATSSVSATGISLAAPGGTCTLAAFVTATAAGTQLNTTSPVTSNQTVTGLPATAAITTGDVFEISYASNLAAGDAEINMTNTAANGDSLNGPGLGNTTGNICVNVYAFAPDEQLISCCSCLLTPNGLVSLSVDKDILANTLTGAQPSSIVVKLLSTLAGPGGSGTNCTDTATAPSPLAPGLQAWRTSLHPGTGGGFVTTETPFTQATLSSGELASIANRCTNIIANGSGFGICKSCRTSGL